MYTRTDKILFQVEEKVSTEFLHLTGHERTKKELFKRCFNKFIEQEAVKLADQYKSDLFSYSFTMKTPGYLKECLSNTVNYQETGRYLAELETIERTGVITCVFKVTAIKESISNEYGPHWFTR